MPYKTRTSHRIGGTFINADGFTRVISDQWFCQAELLNDATLLRINYSFGSVEISGYRLDAIANDVAIGKLGVITVPVSADAVTDVAENAPSVTSIVYIPAPFASSEQECCDA